MTITLRPEQESVPQQAIDSGLVHTTDEAVDRAFDLLRRSLPPPAAHNESAAVAAYRLATFGKRHGLSLGGMTIKENCSAKAARKSDPQNLALPEKIRDASGSRRFAGR